MTSIYNETNNKFINISCSPVVDNKFTVYNNEHNCQFYWSIYATRIAIETEPYKNETTLKGTGPYTWLEK